MKQIGNAGTDGIIKFHDLRKEIEDFDSLPKEWRDLVNSAPAKVEVCVIRQILEYQGRANGLQLIISALKKDFPGWEPYQPTPSALRAKRLAKYR